MRRTARRVAPLLGAVAVLVACSGDDDAAPGPTTATASTATPVATGATATTTAATSAAAPTAGAPTTVATTATASPTASSADPAVTMTPIGTFTAPVGLAWRTGDEAVYVVEQGGRIERVVSATSTTVLDIGDLTAAGGERGLLGLAFDPTGAFAYVDYTDLEGRTTIAEYPVDADGTFRTGDEARTLLVIVQPYPNHNGGGIVFGPDGMLYIGMGDGGSAGDPERRASDPTELLGKLLRIDPTPSGDQPYTVPPDNPFVGQAGTAPEIWASGLRNPWRYSFDPATGDLWIADVGQNAVEEIDAVPATGGVEAGKGLDFGWSAFEGDQPYNADVTVDDPWPPFSTYTHDIGCSISGGVRVRGDEVPDLVGWYVYGDFCAGEVWALEVTGGGATLAPGRQVVLGALPAIAEAAQAPTGEVYVVSQQGSIVRLDPAAWSTRF